MPPISSGNPLPPVDVSALAEEKYPVAEIDSFAREGAVLDRGLRRIAAYGALWFAAFFYLAGVMAAFHFAGLSKLPFTGSWHVVTSVLVALFSVPTVLVLAVLRSTSIQKKDPEADSLHAAIGSKVMAWAEKLVDKVAK